MKVVKIIKSSALYGAYRSIMVAIRSLNRKSHNEFKYPKLLMYGTLCHAVVFRKFRADEFINFHYMERNRKERKRYVTIKESYRFFKQLNYSKYSCRVLDSKKDEYDFFERYYHRDFLAVGKDEIGTEKAVEKLRQFAERNHSFIVKPHEGSGGKGVKIIDTDNVGQDEFAALFDGYENGFSVEQLIEQCEFTAKFHPKSVNTVRINTARYDDGEVELLWPLFRFGEGDSVVDNAAIGGIAVALDMNTGVSIGAADESGNLYTKHPEYGFSLVGFQIPEWGQLCDMARELAILLPDTDCHFVGWDFALMDDGWVVVEANSLPGLGCWQIAAGKGVRSDFERMKSRYGL